MLEGKGADRLNKKEILQIRREVEKLQRSLGGIQNMNMLPDVLFVVDVGYEEIAVKEATKLGIPVVAVVDTNNSLSGIDYVIPGNDDAIRAIKLYAAHIADAILEAKTAAQVMQGDEDDFIEVREEKKAAKAAPKKKVAVKKKVRAKSTSAEKKAEKPVETAEAASVSAEEKAEKPVKIAESAETDKAKSDAEAGEAN